MKSINDYEIKPRDVADKSEAHSIEKAIRLALDVETQALRLNTQTFNRNKYKTVKRLDDYDELKGEARSIKEKSIRELPELIAVLTKKIESRGGKVFLARTGREASEYVRDVCLKHGARLVVKSKSITSEEIGLNHELERAGVEVAETDLAEFILQVSGEQPSHIVAPAIHRSRETISELFRRSFKMDRALETGEELTEFARLILRNKFLSADVGISGANLIAAEEGTILLVESEGNIRLTTQLPAVHVAVAGVEKIIRSKKDFGVFIELLASSGTGQALTSYTNILEPPLETPILNLNGRDDSKREFHLVLVDNGRMAIRDDEELNEALYCVRCSACMNSCANFQAVGGHAFGGECYTGGIGGAWTLATTGSLAKASFAELCTGCSRCVPNCPVRIDIPRLNSVIKERLIKTAGGPSLQQRFFGHFSELGKLASLVPAAANFATNFPAMRRLMESAAGIDRRRAIPSFAKKTLAKEYEGYRRNKKGGPRSGVSLAKTVLFADVFTNYNNPNVGMAVVRAFDKLGIPIRLSAVLDDGRGLQSQGMLAQAKRRAIRAAQYLSQLIDEGNDVIVAEPSVLSMFRRDYASLLGDAKLSGKIELHSFDPIEYLEKLRLDGKLDVMGHLSASSHADRRIFYHAHCQLKTIGAGSVAAEFFRRLGFNVDVSDVECCGMAGSFGYKKKFYDVSKRVGDDLMGQINKTLSDDRSAILLASGTSCREQIGGGMQKGVLHPIEFLESMLP